MQEEMTMMMMMMMAAMLNHPSQCNCELQIHSTSCLHTQDQLSFVFRCLSGAADAVVPQHPNICLAQITQHLVGCQCSCQKCEESSRCGLDGAEISCGAAAAREEGKDE